MNSNITFSQADVSFSEATFSFNPNGYLQDTINLAISRYKMKNPSSLVSNSDVVEILNIIKTVYESNV